MRDVLVRWLCVAVIGFSPGIQAQPESEQDAQDEQEKPRVKVSPCGFDRAGPESLGRLSERETVVCGATGMCTSFWTMQLGLEGEEPLVEVVLDSGLVPGEVDAPRLGVDCSPGRVTLRGQVPSPSAVALEYHEGRFTFARDFLEALERAWTSPTRAPWSLESLEEVGRVLETLSEVDSGPTQSVRLLRARGLLRAERWDPADSLLKTLEQEQLPVETQARRLALADELRRVRARTVPLRVTSWKRLGQVQHMPRLPPWSEESRPTVFWQGTRLCSAQEDVSPPQHMRCHETKTGKWSERLPFALSSQPSMGIQSTYGGRACLYADTCWHSGLPPLEEACGGFDCKGVLALAPGPALVVAEGNGLSAYTQQGSHGLGEREANRLVSQSSGTRLAGGARYVWGTDGRLRPVTQPEKSWQALGAGPPSDKTGEERALWASEPLTSPDQQWVLAVALVKGGSPVLWLGKLEPTQGASLRLLSPRGPGRAGLPSAPRVP